MKLSELSVEQHMYTQLDSTVLAVLSRGATGWVVLIRSVPGVNHAHEWKEVLRYGSRANKTVAIAIVTSLFHPGFEIDLPYMD